MSEAVEAHLALLRALSARNYAFVTPTPLTHARITQRRAEARDLRDVLGWSLPFRREAIDAEIMDALKAANAAAPHGDLFKSELRVSSLDGFLFLHSAYPTTQSDAVFFGPDSYRFAAFLRAAIPSLGPVGRLADIGTGSGVGAITAHSIANVASAVATDINPRALQLALANAAFASEVMLARCERNSVDYGWNVTFRQTSGLDGLDELDCVIANPPYIIDPAHRAYRDGGGMHGAEISLAWAKAAAEKLALGGALLLYTGSAIVNGEDRFKGALHAALTGFDISYRELDPDVFGEELEREDYAEVERIAVVGVVAVKS